MSRFYDNYPRSSPRTARGGIKSQSSRGVFGKSWWARRWISVLESFNIGARLGRGRSYARQGQVLSIDVQEGTVKASVQGSRTTPYKVEIRVKPIADEQWLELSRGALNQAIVAAKLLAGEMPDDVEKLFATNGVSLFPERYDDLKTECSCPDWSNPCKHIAAVYYLLGEEFDRDPFLVFRMRGMDKEKLLELIAGAAAAQPEPKAEAKGRKSGKAVTDEIVEASEPSSESDPLPVESSLFWAVSVPTEDMLGAGKIPLMHANLPKRLGNLPFWRGKESLIQALEDVYRQASENSTSILAKEKLARRVAPTP